MFVLVLLLGILVLAAGAAAAFFGFTIKEFSFGNTLLSMGTTGIVGGLIIIGIAGAIRELRRIGEVLNRQPSPLSRAANPYETSAGRVPAARVPPPPMPPMPPREPPPSAETAHPPAAPAAASGESQAQSPSVPEPLTLSAAEPPPVAPSSAAESPPIVDEHEAIPLSPDPSQYSLPLDAGEPGEPPHEREQSSEAADERSGSSGAPPFEDSALASDQPEPAPPEPASATAEAESAPEPPRPVSILKSGTVEGMAYTLYSDGSIEAQLPSGTIRFASINELRMHLERTG